MKRATTSLVGALVASHAVAQRFMDDAPDEPTSYHLPAIALVLLIALIWLAASEKSPMHGWASDHPWLSVLLIIGVPVLISSLAM